MPIALQINDPHVVPNRGKAIRLAAETGNTDHLNAEDSGYYAGYVAEMAQHGADQANWGFAIAGYYGIAEVENPAYAYENPVFFDTTETMTMRWSSLKKMEDETMLKIIMGEAELDAFDDFVEQWYKLGGETITNEIREMLGE